MFEYFTKNLEALIDSILKPYWDWIMAAPLKTRVLVLLGFFAIGGSIYFPNVPRSFYVKSKGIARIFFAAPKQLPLSPGLTEKMGSLAKRLNQTIKGDLLNLNVVSIGPWTVAQSSAATAGAEDDSLNKAALVSFVRTNTVPGCACWSEIPQQIEPQCTFISGWMMTAFADMNVSSTPAEIRYVIGTQNKDGSWPIFPSASQTQYASTYSTAWNLLGLLHQKGKGFTDKDVDQAIARATGWLLSTRMKGARWKPYPNLSASSESESISGLVLHALHLSVPTQMSELDNEWIANLPSPLIKPSDGENYFISMEGTNGLLIDHFVQIKLPWLLIATVDAFPNGDMLDRAKSLLWPENTLNQESVLNADSIKDNWWRSEFLYALKYMLKIV